MDLVALGFGRQVAGRVEFTILEEESMICSDEDRPDISAGELLRELTSSSTELAAALKT